MQQKQPDPLGSGCFASYDPRFVLFAECREGADARHGRGRDTNKRGHLGVLFDEQISQTRLFRIQRPHLDSQVAGQCSGER